MRAVRRFWRWLGNTRKIARARACGNVIEIDSEDIPRVRIRISGSGNVIRIGKLAPGDGLVKLSLCAQDSSVILSEGVSVSDRLDVLVGQDHPNFGRLSGCRLSVGRNTSFESASVILFNSHASVDIGDDCMFAYDIVIHHTDAHPIYDLDTGKLANPVGELRIGNHVWVGARATILKNSVVPDGCIVGWGSVVAGRFPDPNVAIGGNPARVVSRPGRKLAWKPGDPAYTANDRG